MKDGIDETGGQLLAKGAQAGGHFIEHGAHGVDVGASVDALTL